MLVGGFSLRWHSNQWTAYCRCYKQHSLAFSMLVFARPWLGEESYSNDNRVWSLFARLWLCEESNSNHNRVWSFFARLWLGEESSSNDNRVWSLVARLWMGEESNRNDNKVWSRFQGLGWADMTCTSCFWTDLHQLPDRFHFGLHVTVANNCVGTPPMIMK
jgi:hypothetical protein